MIDQEALRPTIARAAAPKYRGRVDRVFGVLVEAIGTPAAVGELCRIQRGRDDFMDAEVVGFRGGVTLLMPHGDLAGIAPRQPVTALGRSFRVPVGEQLLGRCVDGFGRPMDGGPPLARAEQRSVRAGAPSPFARARIDQALQTGIRAIDGLATIGRGQRLGIFSGAGVGKSSLLSQIARGTDADVCIVALVGERGREVRAFTDEVLAGERMKRSVMVVATSDRPPIERFTAPFCAVTIAESFRDRGLNVLLFMDSVTRFATACREIGLAAGEPPTVRGYPPSFFATVPQLIERMGRAQGGSITGLVTILLDADDPNEPVADALRGLLDGHLLLSRDLAQRGHFPAVDVLASLSRLMPGIVSDSHARSARTLRALLAAWRDGRDLVEIGAYRAGTNPALDKALHFLPAVEAFLRQGERELTPWSDTQNRLNELARAIEGTA